MENISLLASEVTAENVQLKSEELEVITNPSFVSGSETAELPKVLYRRMLSGRTVNKASLTNIFEKVWQNKVGVIVEDYTEGIVILTFGSEAVKNIVIKGQPWNFSGSYLILVEADAMEQVNAESFQKIPFWVQVYGIPPGHLTKPYGERLGNEIANSMGEFMDFDENYRCSFMRIRVGLDISRTLLREEMENGHMPILQYNDSLKTTGLGHVAINDVNRGQQFNKKQFQNVTDATAQAYPKALLMDSVSKRLKVGNTG
ncbi:hypothetical protein AgCh_007602 [Apium graveolens]